MLGFVSESEIVVQLLQSVVIYASIVDDADQVFERVVQCWYTTTLVAGDLIQ
jgi:hypothetical protein